MLPGFFVFAGHYGKEFVRLHKRNVGTVWYSEDADFVMLNGILQQTEGWQWLHDSACRLAYSMA
jgi:hypothetical protein